MYNLLTFDTLRQANLARIPTFKNKHGELVHNHPEGNDWTPSQWLQAMVGELGEFSNELENFTVRETQMFVNAMAKELADVQIYFDLLTLQFKQYPVDKNRYVNAVMSSDYELISRYDLISSFRIINRLISYLGSYANMQKKLERGDFKAHSHENTFKWIQIYIDTLAFKNNIDLAKAVTDKFNEVSKRVGSPVFISEDGSYAYYIH